MDPIAKVPALIRPSSAADSSNVFAAVLAVEPRSISQPGVNGATDTDPGVTIVPLMAIRSPVRPISLDAPEATIDPRTFSAS